jgi:hypothetical protein
VGGPPPLWFLWEEPIETTDFEPTDAQPGSIEKMDVMRERFSNRLPLYHPRDNPIPRLPKTGNLPPDKSHGLRFIHRSFLSCGD